jgi:hypothetical protein
MTELANEANVNVEPTLAAPEPQAKAAQQWLGYVSPVVQRFTGAVLDTRSAIEKRLGFCPLKEAAKRASQGLDALAEGLRRAAMGLRTVAGVAPESGGANGAAKSPEPPQAQA